MAKPTLQVLANRLLTNELCATVPSFLFPLFLIAAASLAIPLLIHLFNLRKYKVLMFPHTRFLQTITLTSRRQNEVRYKWLLALRMLLLLFLVLAFAQPFFTSRNKAARAAALQVLYIDNSQSMTLKTGARTLLEAALEAALRQVAAGGIGQRYLIVINDRPLSYTPVGAEQARVQIQSIAAGIKPKTNNQIFALIQSLLQAEATPEAEVYYYSDFQKNAFIAAPDAAQLKGLNLHYIPVQAPALSNVYIDTAWMPGPVLQTGQPNTIIVRTRIAGDAPKAAPVLQLAIGGQVKSAASINFGAATERTDTLSFSVNAPGWQRLSLSIADAAVRFDDSFFIAARSAPALSVLVLNEGQANPYIQAAFRSWQGFQVTQGNTGTPPADWAPYNLIILNGVSRLDNPLAAQCAKALQTGQSILIFPARTPAFEVLSAGLRQLADVRISGYDTARQAATTLQQGSDLARDLFDRVPENVELPVASWHYALQAGLSGNPQAVLSFRNGDPMLLALQPARGRLYLTAMSADLESGNFPGSYFFVPFLYQMAVQSRGSDVYAITAGTGQPAYLPLSNAGERNMVHARGPGAPDVIPPQRPAGAGLNVFLDEALSTPGFYQLSAAGADSVVAGFNASRAESNLDLWNMDALRKAYTGPDAAWQDNEKTAQAGTGAGLSLFPLWKICVILTLLLLAAETYLLVRKPREKGALPA